MDRTSFRPTSARLKFLLLSGRLKREILSLVLIMTQVKKYSLEFKIKAVELSILKGSQTLVAKELDVCAKNISRWKKAYDAGELDGTVKNTTPKTDLELENTALKKALLDAELERDILKKAVAIFSKKDR